MSKLIVKAEEGNPQSTQVTPRQRKLRSVVWNDFTKELKEDGGDIATCNHCSRKFTGASRSGTTHLRNHLRFCASYERAKRKKLDIVRGQSTPSDEKSPGGAIVVHEVVDGNGVLLMEGGSSQIQTFNDEACNSRSQLSTVSPVLRCRKLRSLVWNDFSKEQREDGSLVAICNHCKKQMAGGSRSGTTHLKKHLGKCLLYQRSKRRRGDVGPAQSKWGDTELHVGTLSLDQELVEQDLAHMVILHEYPFSIVNHVGFRDFVRDLQPQFKLMPAEVLQESCMKVYEDRRLSLFEELSKLNCRVNVSAEIWSSGWNLEYLHLRCHFVDEDWKLRRKVISFWHVDSPQDSGIAKLMLDKLTEWNVDSRVFSAVMEESSAGEKALDELVQLLRPRRALLLDGALFHVHSCSHVLNLIVQDGLAVIAELVNKVRYGVNLVRSSQAKLEAFRAAAAAARAVGAPQKPLVVDDLSRWDTTYLMLTAASELRDAFVGVATGDEGDVLSSEDWENIKAVNECLGAFYLLTEKPTPRKSPTVNLCFNGMCGIHLSLKTWSGSSHPLVNAMATKMLGQFEKHWGLTSVVLATASVLDPRYKMKSIEYFFRLIYAEGSVAELKIGNILLDFRSLYDVYAAAKCDRSSGEFLASSAAAAEETDGENNGISRGSSQNLMADLRFGLDQYLQETSSSQPMKSDLDLYLEEAVHPSLKGLDEDFDILAWWKNNAPKYPVLAEMARDVLSIPVSISSPETGSRTKTLYHNHSSMDPITLQGLICAQDWLRSEIDESTLSGSTDGLSTIFAVDR
ncbi:zinc finger BED domain-containing protein RICESLEEPER 2-like [Wolffia australiana]